MRTFLVTGASGFIGQALCARLRSEGAALRMVTRNSPAALAGITGNDIIRTADNVTDWRSAMQGVDCLVHLAARTHVMRETSADPLAEYRRVNVDFTRELAQAAVAAGVRRFVFLSSIQIHGLATTRPPASEKSAPEPQDASGATKREGDRPAGRGAGAGCGSGGSGGAAECGDGGVGCRMCTVAMRAATGQARCGCS